MRSNGLAVLLATALAALACDPGQLVGPEEELTWSGAAAAENALANPGCEQSTAGWIAWQGTLTRTTAVAHSGQAACRVRRAYGSAYSIDDAPAAVSAPAGGTVYRATAWVRSGRSAGKPVQLFLRQRGGSRPTTIAASASVRLRKTWQRLEAQATIDAPDRATLELYVAQTAAAAGDELDVDDLTLVRSDPVPAPAPSVDAGALPPTADAAPPPSADAAPSAPPAADAALPPAPPSADAGTVAPPPPPPGTRRPFDDTSPYNAPIPPSPALDPNAARAAMVNKSSPAMSLYYWSPRIYEVDGNKERRVRVSCTESWGTCELEDATQSQAGGVPIPVGARGAPEADAHMVIWDVANQLSYDFWRYRYPNNSAPEGQTSWGGVVSTAGNGVDSPGGRLAAGGSTGSDIARLAGVIRVAEVRAGVIPHALVGPTSNSCSTFRWPARKSDGWSTRADCLPEGARLQLDPAIDLNQVQGLRPIDRMVARALQTYGWYNIDNGGTFNGSETKWVVQFEVDPQAQGASCPAVGQAYCSAGATAEYDALRGTLPDGTRLYSHMRVLASWNGR